MLCALLAAHCEMGVARDCNEALACLDEWQVPRSHRVRVSL